MYEYEYVRLQTKRWTKEDLERLWNTARKLNKEDAMDRNRWRKLITVSYTHLTLPTKRIV